MSAIAGIHHVDGRPVHALALEMMLGTMMHRGSDGIGTWIEDQTAFGQGMLFTTPESHDERFPLRARSGSLVLIADARIDNRDELVTLLNNHINCRDIVTDGQVILAAYEKWGARCVERFVGDFAFAIWDKRNHVLFCARDHLGVRPFCYCHRRGLAFYFASEIKAMTCLSDVPQQLNEARIADYLFDDVGDRTNTFYVDILRLPPAHVLTLSNGQCSTRRYWAPDSVGELKLPSDDHYDEAFRHVFKTAVHSRLRSTGPIGICLSGGVDSSAVACVAKRMLGGNDNVTPQTFSLLYDRCVGGDERSYIFDTVEQNGFDAHFIQADEISPLEDLDRLMYHFDEPFDNPHLPLGWALWKNVRERGVRVLLDGVDGDVTLSYAFEYLTELSRQGCWATLAREAVGLSRHFYLEQISPLSILWNRGIKSLLAPRCSHVLSRLRRRQPWLCKNGVTLNPDFAKRVDCAARVDFADRESCCNRSSRQAHCSELTDGVVAYGLETTNKLCSAFGIEPRHPFFDKRLVDFCVALPREQRIRDGWTRLILRRAFADLLPKSVLWRGNKWNANSFFADRLLAHEKDILEDVIVNDPHEIESYVDLPSAREAFKRLVNQPTISDAYYVWTVGMLALWLRRACQRAKPDVGR